LPWAKRSSDLRPQPFKRLFSMNPIYLDCNATTPLHPEVLEAMLPYLRGSYGNPSSIHRFGREAKQGIEEAREKIARLISAAPMEIVFTGGGTEADNLAIKGAAYSCREKGRHVITSSLEHHAVLHTCRHLESEGFRVTYLPVDRWGRVEPDEVRRAVTKETVLISIMHSNNEVGTLQPIEEIGKIARGSGVLFHVDAIQSIGKVSVDVGLLGADLLSMSAHKISGPKGVGGLFVRKGVRIEPLLHGGHHEMNRRAGTENVAGIVGFGKAAEMASFSLVERQTAVRTLRDYFWERIEERIPYVHLNGHPSGRLPNTLHVSFEFVGGESLLILLDLSGVAASGGSACTSGAQDPSHVLSAMGIAPEIAQGSIRFSLGNETTREEIDRVVEALTDAVTRLRSMSPLYADRKNPGIME
jgi:cysteine desulfurase